MGDRCCCLCARLARLWWLLCYPYWGCLAATMLLLLFLPSVEACQGLCCRRSLCLPPPAVAYTVFAFGRPIAWVPPLGGSSRPDRSVPPGMPLPTSVTRLSPSWRCGATIERTVTRYTCPMVVSTSRMVPSGNGGAAQSSWPQSSIPRWGCYQQDKHSLQSGG